MPRRNDELVVFIVPERHQQVRRLRIKRRTINRAVALALLLLCCLTFGLTHYVCTVSDARRTPGLLAENAALTVRLTGLQNDIDRLDAALSRIDATTSRVRAITQLNDPARNLSLGPLHREPAAKGAPVLYAPGERTDSEDEVMDSKVALRLIEEGLDANLDHLASAQDKVDQLTDYLDAHPSLIATTPAIRPTASHLVGGHFGLRKDPFTGLEVVHKGVDFVAELGADVFAPADGRVIFSGQRSAGYGETVVLDHGFGVQTLFAHLSRIDAALGELVLRGQKLGAVGHSGRTTGAHLHYEVRYNGLPFDPERFILD